MPRAAAETQNAGPLEQSPHRDSRLLEELLRGQAPQHALLQEGFTKQEIRAARKRVDLDISLERSIGPAAGRPTWTPATGHRGASVPTSASCSPHPGGHRLGGQDVDARRALEPTHSGNTGGAATV